MTRSYPEQLAEWVKHREKVVVRDLNLVAFLAVKDDVKAAVDEGWATRTIWAHLVEHKRIPFGYDTFLKFVKQQIRGPHAARRAVEAAVPGTPRRSAQVEQQRQAHMATPATAPRTKPLDPLPGFTFNAAPNKEDLI